MVEFFEQTWFFWWFFAIVIIIRWVHVVGASSALDMCDSELEQDELPSLCSFRSQRTQSLN